MIVHLAFTGKEVKNATIVIDDGTMKVIDGLKEKADLIIECDSEQWLKIINKEVSIFGVLKLLLESCCASFRISLYEFWRQYLYILKD